MALVYDKASSLQADGHRNYVHPADVSGRYDRVRQVAFAVLLVVFAGLPWLQIGGHPAVFLDVLHRRFYLFGGTFNAQDFWLVFFLLTGVGYGLFVVTSLWGRVWCGYACPQTVFLEGVFRPIERWLEGPRNVRMRRNAGPWNRDKVLRKGAKHLIYVVLSFLVAHVVLSYFVSLPGLYAMVLSDPAAHPEAFVWAISLTGVIYFVFSWFREQVCLIVCPYGRLQSVMTDRDTLVIGYDSNRGEPRGKASAKQAGDCVDCKRCVVVCPTGIDIRNGLQIDCIGCARCIDACDEVMVKLRRPTGLVRYDSSRGLAGEERRPMWRPRLWFYAVLGVVGTLVLSFALARQAAYEANVLRLPGPPYTVADGQVRNGFQIHIINKSGETAKYHIQPGGEGGVTMVVAMPELELASFGSQMVPVFVTFPEGTVADGTRVSISLKQGDEAEPRRLMLPLAAPH